VETRQRRIKLKWLDGYITSMEMQLQVLADGGQIPKHFTVAEDLAWSQATEVLGHARQDAVSLGVDVEYVLSDMRDLPWVEHFEAIVSWFTAFGYFDDEGNRAVLAAAHAALKAGGTLLLDLNNRDRLTALDRQAALEERDDNYLIDRMRYDVASGRMRTERTVLRAGRVHRMRFDLRLFTYPELATWLRQAGFRQIAGYDEEGKPFERDSQRMVVVATK
jgi:SAM-dependent methyltransferase